MMRKRQLLSGKTILLDKFPTHLPHTDNKKAPNRYTKLNYQKIYNGEMNKFARAILMKNMHDYIASRIPNGFGTFKTAVKPYVVFYVVRNHGDIRRLKSGKISWKPIDPNKEYKASWDDDNFAFMWIKAIKDTLSHIGAWEDDNVDFSRGLDYDIAFVDDIEDRKIIINFISLIDGKI